MTGVSFFSYAVPAQPANLKPGTDLPAAPVTGSDRLAFLSAAFPRPAPVPRMDWIDAPDRGWIAGVVEGADGVVVTVRRRRLWPFSNTTRVRTDGNGYFALAKVKPGRYEVEVRPDRSSVRKVAAQVTRGRVARVTLPPR